MDHKRIHRLCLLIMSVFLLCGCTGSVTGYGDETVVKDNVYYELSDRGKSAFASTVVWDLDLSHTDIVIPEEVEGHTVEKLGGYTGTGVPTPFTIEAMGSYDVFYAGGITDCGEPMRFEELVFDVYLPKTVNDYDCIRSNPSITMKDEYGFNVRYEPVFRFHVDSENPYLYEKDGVLYKKKDDSALNDPNFSPHPDGNPGHQYDDETLGGKLLGRYTYQRGDSLLVSDLFECDGTLYMNTGAYMEGSLYSFYGAVMELTSPEDLNKYSIDTTEVKILQFSDFSLTGEYWSEEPAVYDLQVDMAGITFTPKGEEGESLFYGEKETVRMERTYSKESQFPSIPGDIDWMLEAGDTISLLYPSHNLIKSPYDSKDVFVKFFSDGTILIQRKEEGVAKVYKGVYRSLNKNTSLIFSVSKLGGGTMPYIGKVDISEEGSWMVIPGYESFPIIEPKG